MITKLFYLSLFIGMMIPSFVFAQPLSGTKTIGGTNPDYTTFALAVSALNTNGINGSVVFNVAPGTYTEQITINNITGSSSANTITFKSSNNDSTAVTLAYASSATSTNNFVVNLDGTDYILFKHMTIERTATNNYAVVVSVSGTSNNVSFENNILKNAAIGSTTDFTSLIYAPNGTGNTHTNHTYYNNKFVNGGIGIYNFGSDANTLSTGTKVEHNIFINQGKWAMALWYQDGPEINSNEITSTSTNSSYCAFNGNYCKNAFRFTKNKLILTKGTGLYLQTSPGNSNTGLITNNFISISGSGAKGMSYNNSGYHNIYFNSIRMNGSNSYGFHLSGTGSTAIRFKNNIVQVAASSSCMDVTNTVNPFSEMDYNDYYFPSGNMGKYKSLTVHTTLASWQTATAKEANSMNAIPNFISATNLHINNSTIGMQGTSANTSPFPLTDIDNNLRNTLTPDIGAHEFTVSDIALDSIHINTQMCDGGSYSITLDIKNMGTAPISAMVPVGYQMGVSSSIQLGLANIQNLAPGAIFAFTPTVQVLANPLGNHAFKAWVKMQNDTDPANDTTSIMVSVSPYPISKLPNDSSICAGLTMVLDPGAGFDSYLWYDGTSTQTYSLDSNGIGIGGKYIAVTITDNGCSIMDSTLVLFKDCSSIDQSILSNSLYIYPNPASDFITIENQSTAVITKIEIIAIDGHLVKEINQGDMYNINIAELASGIYYLRIESKEGIAIKKIMKK